MCRRAGNQLYVAARIYDLRQYDALSVIGWAKAGAAMAIVGRGRAWDVCTVAM